jgi:hypothetical protein
MIDPHNPHYGETGAVYGAVFYSAGAPVNPPKSKNHMAEIKLSLSRANPTKVIEVIGRLISLLAPVAPATPPIPNMAAKVADLTTKYNAAKTANDAYEAAKSQLGALKTTRDETADALRAEADVTANAAMTESKGEAAMLQAGGFDVTGTSAPPPPPSLEAPSNLLLTAGDQDGSVDASCDPPGPKSIIRSYQWQYTTGDPLTGTYVDALPTTASGTTLTGLTSGQRIWVRVRVNTTHGTTGWSDPATKIVP